MAIQLQRVKVICCPHCQATIDASRFKPLQKQHCPKCATEIDIPAMIGKYMVTSRIDRDSRSSTFRALDTSLERRVVLRIFDEQDQDGKLKDSLQELTRRLAGINHTNVARVLSVGELNDKTYVEMELLDGGTAQDLLRMREPLSEIEALSIAINLASGLRAAAKGGLLHLDLKPISIRFDAYSTPKLTDFAGLSLKRQHISAPLYAAPELLQKIKGAHKQVLDIRSDIYSLGAVLFHLLTKKPPFKEAPPLPQTHNEAYITGKMTNLRPDISPPTARLIAKMLSFNIEKRPDKYSILIEALEKIQDTFLVSDAPLSEEDATSQLQQLAEMADVPVKPTYEHIGIASALPQPAAEADTYIDDMESGSLSSAASSALRDALASATSEAASIQDKNIMQTAMLSSTEYARPRHRPTQSHANHENTHSRSERHEKYAYRTPRKKNSYLLPIMITLGILIPLFALIIYINTNADKPRIDDPFLIEAVPVQSDE